MKQRHDEIVSEARILAANYINQIGDSGSGVSQHQNLKNQLKIDREWPSRTWVRWPREAKWEG